MCSFAALSKEQGCFKFCIFYKNRFPNNYDPFITKEELKEEKGSKN